MGTIGSKTRQIIFNTYEKLEEMYPIYSKGIKLSELSDEVYHYQELELNRYQELGLNLVDIHLFSLHKDKSESSGLYCTIIINTITEDDIPIPSKDIWGLVNTIFNNNTYVFYALSNVNLVSITDDLVQVTFKLDYK